MDCQFDAWGSWGACTVSSGRGYRARVRGLTHAAHGGRECEGPLADFAPCGAARAHVDCELDTWSDWGACSCSCDGHRERSRDVRRYAEGLDASFCRGALKEVAPCLVGACAAEPRDCALSGWSAWDSCSATCGGAQRGRSRDVATSAAGGGAPCAGALAELAVCGMAPCASAALNCTWAAWSAWGDCFSGSECGAGERKRTRHIVSEARNVGACAAQDASEIVPCVRACGGAAHCAWGPWSAWGDCSATCGEGQARATRSMEQVYEGVASKFALGTGFLAAHEWSVALLLLPLATVGAVGIAASALLAGRSAWQRARAPSWDDRAYERVPEGETRARLWADRGELWRSHEGAEA